MLNSLILILIRAYQKTLSPDKGLFSPWLKGKICHHHPHCSEYAKHCFERYNTFTATTKTMERITRCTGSDHIHYDPSHYRVVFVSSAPIGVSFLQELYTTNTIEVVGIITMSDAPSGRGQKLKPNIIKQTALDLGTADTDIITPTTLSQKKEDGLAATTWLVKKKIDYLIVIAYGKIIPQAILDVSLIAPLNIHGSILPAYRGASPLQSVFLDQKKETGITMMRMEAGLDTGPIIDTKKKNLGLNETVIDLIEWINTVGPRFLIQTLTKYAREELLDKEQNEEQATHCTKFVKEDGLISLTDSISDISSKYRALALWPKIFFEHNNKTHTIASLTLNEELYEQDSQGVFFDGKKLHPAVDEVIIKPEGKKNMDRVSWMNGYL